MTKERINIICGDIVSNEILSLGDAIVLPTNPMMRPGAGVSGAIFKKAGVDELENYTSQTYDISYSNPIGKNEMKVKEIRITPGFALKIDIIFAQGPKIWDYDDYDLALKDLLETYLNIFKESQKHSYSSIIIPSLGTGEYGFEHEKVAEIVVKKLYEYSNLYNINVILVIYNDYYKSIYEKYLAHIK